MFCSMMQQCLVLAGTGVGERVVLEIPEELNVCRPNLSKATCFQGVQMFCLFKELHEMMTKGFF